MNTILFVMLIVGVGSLILSKLLRKRPDPEVTCVLVEDQPVERAGSGIGILVIFALVMVVLIILSGN